METKQDTNTDFKDLCAKYNWFAKSYPPVIQKASDEFFLPGLRFTLLGVCKNVNVLMDKDSYFVTKVRIDEMHDMFFRSSENAIGILLEKALGKPDTKFNLNKLTDLEAKVITTFNDFMFNMLAQFLQPAPPTLKRTNFDVIHLTFVIVDVEKNVSAKFIVTLPDVLLAPDIVVSTGDKFSSEDFSTSTVEVGIKVGSTRFRIIDLQNIEEDDIVVFDNSDTRHMVLKFRDYEKDIKLNPNLGLIMPVDNDEGEDNMADNTNLWDSIEVEMNAEFDAVRITLGELKKIEEGLVVDLTSIYDNRVTLSVENKPIARGELVIVNDRYGVKVNEVLARAPKTIVVDDINNQSVNSQPMENVQEQAPVEAQPQQPVDEEDEFDYSDFELEDEDI